MSEGPSDTSSAPPALLPAFCYGRSPAPLSFCFLNFPKQKGLRGKAFTSGNFCWVGNSSCASTPPLPGLLVNSSYRVNIHWILRYRGSSDQFSGAAFSTAPVGLFLPGAASLRKCQGEGFVSPGEHSFGNYSASVSLANGFAAPSLQQQPCHGRRAAHTKRAPTRSEGTKPSEKPGTWRLRCAGTRSHGRLSGAER